MIISSNRNTTFEQPPVGAHLARCVRIIDIGTQKGEYKGMPTFRRQVVIAWELPGELMSSGEYAGKPFMVSQFYTASLHEKSGLRKDLAAWRTRDFTEQELAGFDLSSILGKPCMVSLIKNEKDKTKINAVMGAPKGSAIPAQINPIMNFSLDDFNEATFNALSDGYKKLIAQSPEYQQIRNPQTADQAEQTNSASSGFEDMDDDIPF